LVEEYKAEGKEIPTIPQATKAEEDAGTGNALSDADARLKEEMAALSNEDSAGVPADDKEEAAEASAEEASEDVGASEPTPAVEVEATAAEQTESKE
jgi:hypothetical protein